MALLTPAHKNGHVDRQSAHITGDMCVEDHKRICADMCAQVGSFERRSVRAFGAPTSNAGRQFGAR
jgi:hypothetical protein